MLFQTYALKENISLEDCVDLRPDCLSCAVGSLSTLSAKRSANRTLGPKSSSWNSPHPFHYSARIKEVFTLQKPAKKIVGGASRKPGYNCI